ncbi:hypothetical protein CsSME_00002430 [Camellia sinensis var. sinensis]
MGLGLQASRALSSNLQTLDMPSFEPSSPQLSSRSQKLLLKPSLR